MLLDRYLPPEETVVLKATVVPASAARAIAGLRSFDLFRSAALRLPNKVRLWPERLWRRLRRKEPLPPAPKQVTLDELISLGSFEALEDAPGEELVLGSMGRFWTRDFGPVPFTRQSFSTSNPPDVGKIAWSIWAVPYGAHRALLVADVRVHPTDPAARRHFRRYWRLVGPAVRLMTATSLRQARVALGAAPQLHEQSAPELLIERQLPTFDVRSVAVRAVDADAATTYAAARRAEALMSEDPLIRFFGNLRALPQKLGRRRQKAPAGSGFTLLEERRGEEYVVGMVGRFWEPGLGLQPVPPAEFATFHQPGFAKVAQAFTVKPLGDRRSLLIAETRTATTDPKSRRRFAAYWRLMQPFAALVTRRQLALIQRAAEKTARPKVASVALQPG